MHEIFLIISYSVDKDYAGNELSTEYNNQYLSEQKVAMMSLYY